LLLLQKKFILQMHNKENMSDDNIKRPSPKSRKLTRREALSTAGKVAAGVVVAGVIAGIGGYYAGASAAPKVAETVTETVTAPGTTVTKTVTVGGATVTKTVTATAPGTATTMTVTTGVPTGAERYFLDKQTAFKIFHDLHSWEDWWHNAPKVGEYKKDPPYKVGFITSWRGNPWQETAIAEFKREARRWRDAGLLEDYVHMDSAGSIDTEISNLESMFAMWQAGELDAILVDPLDPKALNSTIEKIYDAGCPIILWNNPADTTKYTMCVINDDWSYGVNDAKWLVKQLNGKGDIFFFRGLKGYPIDYARSEGALSIFKEYPDINIVAIDYGDWSYDKAKKLFLDFVSAHPKFDGIYSVGGQMSSGIIDAMIELGIDPRKPHASEDQNGFMQRCLKHNIPACASAHPSINCAIALDLTIMLLQGYPVPKMYFFPQPFFTWDDFPKYVRPNIPEGVFVYTPLPDEIINKVLSGEWKDVKWIPEKV